MSFRQIAAKYADDVLSGEIPACEFVRLACSRFMNDLERDDISLFYDDDAERWCKFLELLPHVKGKWAGKKEKFKLSPWQVFCTVNMYGWKNVGTGLRRFREAYVEVPRKNGKSFWVAGLGIGHLCIDGEMGGEIYCGATSEKQAWEVFKPARLICERSPDLLAKFGVEVNAKSLNTPGNGSIFQPVIGKPGDGPSPSFGIADEYHEHKDSDQVDTFQTGMGAREQPMMAFITTAGSDMGGPCYAKRADCIDILTGAIDDDRVFAIIYGLDEEDEWDTVEAQKKANPNFGVSVNAEYLEGQLSQARRSAVKQNSYKTKHLNQWVGAKQAWMNMLAFQACRKKNLKMEDFHGMPCVAAIDLASKKDLASLVVLFEDAGRYYAFAKHYLPEELIINGGDTRYKAFHAAGWITATPGNIIDYSAIEDDLASLRDKFEVLAVPYDPFQATQFATRMMDEDFPMIEYGATVRNFSEPMKELDALIIDKKIEFEMDPVLMWCFGNVVAALDAKDNIFPRKERPENKIDPVVALIMALGAQMKTADDSIDQTHVAL